MRKGIWLAAIVVFFVAPHRSQAQQTQQSGQSQASAPSKTQTSGTQPAAKSDPLVEAARKNREAQKNAPKASAVFTNDNIPATPGAVSVVGSTAAETSDKSSTAASSDKTATAGEASSSTKKDEATWRKKFADARQKLAQDQKELSILQRESDQLQLQYYPDPTKALMQSVDRSDIIKKQKAIDDKKKQIDADQQAISTLESELRQAGGDPGWARE